MSHLAGLREKRGALVLLFLLLVLCAAIFIRYSTKPQRAEIKIVNREIKEEKDLYELKSFDPNELDSTGFAGLGFTPKQVVTILNYRTSLGGRFASKEKFRKCYAISEKKWQEIESFVEIKQIVKKQDAIKKTLFNLDINSAGLNELKSHTLVDDRLAQKLFSARIKYGGFICFGQMDEIFRKDKTALAALEAYIIFDTAAVVRYNVNEDNAPLLAQHPYIRQGFAEAVVELRQSKGKIENFAELKTLKYFPKSKERWLEYYLEF